MSKYKKVLKKKSGYTYTNKYGTKVKVKPHKQHYQVKKYKDISKREKSLFFESKSDKYSEMVRLKSPQLAKISVKELQEEFDRADTKHKKRRIANITQLARNRADAMLNRKDLSANERDELKDIRAIYDRASTDFWDQYSKSRSIV